MFGQYHPILILLPVLCAFGIACLATGILAHHSGRFQILDHPNERSLHNTPIPRTGGLAIWIGAIAGTIVPLMLLGTPSEVKSMVGAVALLGAVSLIDDRFHIPVTARLAAQVLAAMVLMINGLRLETVSLPGMTLEFPGVVEWCVGVLFVIWMTNLYNFMDGMDGLAAGMAVIGFGTFAVLGGIAGEPLFVILNLAVAGAAGGFLIHNFPPARIFMGDSGSSALGFLAAAFMLWAERDDIFPLWTGVLIFLPFVADATMTLIRRVIHRDRIWVAHKTHYYQRLVRLGWSQRRATLTEYGLMGACSISAVVGMRMSVAMQWALIVAWIACYAGLIAAVKRMERDAQRI